MKAAKSPAPTPVRVAMAPTLISVEVTLGADGTPWDDGEPDGEVVALVVVPEHAATPDATSRRPAAITPGRDLTGRRVWRPADTCGTGVTRPPWRGSGTAATTH